ncbi:unnamed protein product [Notodromas monacha]|uniref:ELMO domain-containing protein n=1 Tax=Notodromas monacha TaxID=399045 RepID=A0A7R9GC51_9CRUS|nr:unnamed protein product [Notodromas monacha]CAG0917238.1 unnamed protein product [Notodromas monacha]
MRPESDPGKVIKLAVVFVDHNFENRGQELFKIDQSASLNPQIQDVCNIWKIGSEDADDYALQFDEEKTQETNDRYITEANRGNIKTGSMLKLTLSPDKMSKKIVHILKALGQVDADSDGETLLAPKALEEMVRLSYDPEFIAKFNHLDLNGLDILMDAIQTGRATDKYLEQCLQTFVNMMTEGARSWDSLPDALIKKLISFLEKGLKHTPSAVSLPVLTVLENLIVSCPDKCELVKSRIAYPTLASFLADSKCKKVRQGVVALVNALLSKAHTDEARQEIGKNVFMSMKNAILEVVNDSGGLPWSEMLDHLCQLQMSILSLYESRSKVVCDLGSSEDAEKIKHLRRVAFDEAGSGSGDRDKRREQYSLGFSDENEPLRDFCSPPGRLYLDCLKHYADHHERQFARMAIENSSKDSAKFSLVETGIKLVGLLFDILEINSNPISEGNMIMNLGLSLAMHRNFQPMFFSTDHPFEEMFSRTMDLFGRTWKEMKATVQDMDKVMDVVREQLVRALSHTPASMNFTRFSETLETLSYAQIKAIWDQERSIHEEHASRAEPIQQLRDALKLEIVGLIAEQRTLFLIDGSRFIKTSGPRRGKDSVKSWFCRLAPNRKSFHYGDCKEEKDEVIPSIDYLQSKIELDQIKELTLKWKKVGRIEAGAAVMINKELSGSKLESVGSVLGLSSTDPLDTFAGIWYQVFLWNLFLNFIVYTGAGVAACVTLRRHPLMRFFGVVIIVCGILTPITFGIVNSSVIAFVCRTADLRVTPLWALICGAVQVLIGIGNYLELSMADDHASSSVSTSKSELELKISLGEENPPGHCGDVDFPPTSLKISKTLLKEMVEEFGENVVLSDDAMDMAVMYLEKYCEDLICAACDSAAHRWGHSSKIIVEHEDVAVVAVSKRFKSPDHSNSVVTN